MAGNTPQKQASSKINFQLKMIIAVLLIVFGALLVEYTSLLYKSYQITQKKQWFIEENQRLIDGNRDLEKQYEYYKTDYFFRKEAKRKLNKKEPGESVVIVSGGDSQVIANNEWEISSQILNKWWLYIFGEREITKESFQ